jgi:hypothetical protein
MLKLDFTPLMIREIKLNYSEMPDISIRMTLIKNSNQVTSVGKDVQKLEPSVTTGESVKWCNHFQKQFDRS